MATTLLATESKRPSLTQNIEDLYASLRAGGAFDVKKQLNIKGHSPLQNSIQSSKHTKTGFKLGMSETEFNMVKTGKDTTMMKSSIYGHHSTKKYWNM